MAVNVQPLLTFRNTAEMLLEPPAALKYTGPYPVPADKQRYRPLPRLT